MHVAGKSLGFRPGALLLRRTLAFLVGFPLGHIGLTLALAAETHPSKNISQQARIARIENGLLSAVVIKGQKQSGMALADRMKHYKVPGVSIAFFEHGEITWSRTYGYAELATKKPVTPETLFQAASISKAATALAALRLVRQGQLDLDEPVNEKLTDWKVPDNEFTKDQGVTLRRLLSHSAGLTVSGFPGYAGGQPVPSIVQILNGESPANTKPVRVDTVPGTTWKYSGGGYTVVQLLLMNVTGKSFAQILDESVLQPTGMTHSTFAQPLTKSAWPVATPYQSDGTPLAGGAHTYPELGAAGLWTTPSDLARMAMEVQNEYAGASDKILSQDLARQMLTRQIGDWGLGFSLAGSGDQLRFGHGGSNGGFRCVLESYVGSGQGIAIMTNSDGGDPLVAEIERAAAKEYGWPHFRPQEKAVSKIDAKALLQYAGVYQITVADVINIKVIVTAKNRRLYLQAAPFGAEDVEMYPESQTNFFSTLGFSIAFGKDERGLTKITVHAGEDYEAKRIPFTEGSGADQLNLR